MSALERLSQLLQLPYVAAPAAVAASLVCALFVELLIRRTLLAWARRTQTPVDDQVIGLLRRPVFQGVILAGLAWAAAILARPSAHWHLSVAAHRRIVATLQTVAVAIFTIAAIRVSRVLLESLSRRKQGAGLVQPRTLPVFDIALKLVAVGLGIYLLLVAWEINASGWLASAGILGIVLGLAAKDTLGNLFAGIFILADAPYKLGDFIVLDGNLRGRVIDIGIRSTRIHTLDDIEITVPNSLIANSTIVNETAGPDKMRIKAKVSVAYGSDVDRVREAMLSCVDTSPTICSEPAPRVRLTAFGDSGLDFELLVWLDQPHQREEVINQLNIAIYKAFAAAAIEIPYPKRDVYLKALPEGVDLSPRR
ncbi:MAG: mechanosensitive ion channel family protein [Deltaproteobacteria bacterium]|nr:mechanosensitive ion channel family protein [Deltaproteobacteria bacterium]